MGVVSGQPFIASAHNTAELEPPSNDSDDEYGYVSSLAEQIAHAMLDDDEPLEEENLSGAKLDAEWSSHRRVCSSTEMETKTTGKHTNARVEPSSDCSMVSHTVHHGRDLDFIEGSHPKGSHTRGSLPLEGSWEDFYLQNKHSFLQRAFRRHSYHSQDASAGPCGASRPRNHQESSMYQGWSRSRCFNRRQAAVCSRAFHREEYSCEAWRLPPLEARTALYGHVTLPKESIGTGVFLPRVMNSDCQLRRKTVELTFGEKQKRKGQFSLRMLTL